jgi:hypothetical protein
MNRSLLTLSEARCRGVGSHSGLGTSRIVASKQRSGMTRPSGSLRAALTALCLGFLLGGCGESFAPIGMDPEHGSPTAAATRDGRTGHPGSLTTGLRGPGDPLAPHHSKIHRKSNYAVAF